MGNGTGSVFRPPQERRLRVSLQEIDRLLTDIEAVLESGAAKSPFPKYIIDLTPAQRKTIADYVARIRERLARVLSGQNLEPEPPSIPATRAIHSALTFIDIALEELRPRHMRGYGEVQPDAATELNGIVGELSALVQQLDRYVTQSGQELSRRLSQLEETGAEIGLLKQLERIISSNGLVEFRAPLDIVLSRLGDPGFEIAVFGRVSSGKSSLLNAVLNADVLPVGVTPITAVPTRIMYGENAGLTVWSSDRAPLQGEIGRLGEFASEQQNPCNAKRVSRIVLRLPSMWLKGGIVFVDTPGLGSLATNGAAETLAYLPHCDLGVMLIDAGAALSTGDLQTIDALYRSGIPVQVLLSKADLLNEHDLSSVLEYTTGQLKSELGVDLALHPVSVAPGKREILDGWFQREIVPLLGRRLELQRASVRRKIGALRQSVEAALRKRLQRMEQEQASATGVDARALDADLRHVEARFEETREISCRIADSLPELAHSIISQAAERLAGLDDRQQNDSVHSTVGTVAMEVVHERIRTLQMAFTTLADNLVKELASAAQKLNTSNSPVRQEFYSLVREMPVLDIGSLQVASQQSALIKFAGKRLEVLLITHWLQKYLRPQLIEVLTAHSRMLRNWSKQLLEQMQRRFATYADVYRSQAEEERGRVFLKNSLEERQGLQQDIELLAEMAISGSVRQAS